MHTKLAEPDFDVVIVGSGIAGALMAHRLAQANVKVLMLEAGGVAPDALGRYSLVHNYIESGSRTTDSPFCGDNILAPQPTPGILGVDYYDYPQGYTGDKFVSYYERLVGGSTWHWQAIYVRMLPNDFAMESLYQKGADWPIGYAEIEPWYVAAEREMGVAGETEERQDVHHRRYQIKYPMPALAPSFLDSMVTKAVAKVAPLDGVPLRVTTVPHAINSRNYDGRPACEGFTSCVPLCPIKARYEAIVHVERALAIGAALRTQSVATKLQFDESGEGVTGVHYRRWQWNDANGRREPISEPDRLVTGKIVVIAANGIENPMLLLRSNAANSSGLVGCNLMDHPIKQSYALAPEPLFPFRGPQTTSQFEGFRDGQFRQSFAGFKTSIKNDGWSTNATGAPRGNKLGQQEADDWHPGTILDLVQNRGYFGDKLHDAIAHHAVRQITLNSACEQLPVKENRVSLSSNVDELNIERPRIQYTVDDPDGYVRQAFTKIVEFHGRVFDALAIPVDHRKMQQDAANAKLTFGGSGHIMGTTRMGRSPEDSVVDARCRTHDHPNLYVLGSSVFPTSSTANPTSTIAALALRAAETIKKQLKG